MAGELTPLVLLPRYTTYAGASTFVTIAMDATEYESAIVSVWRGKLVGTSPTITFEFRESSDQINWTPCGGFTPTTFDPGEETEAQKSPLITKRWFRIQVVLTGTSPPVATCWAVGFLVQRQS